MQQKRGKVNATCCHSFRDFPGINYSVTVKVATPSVLYKALMWLHWSKLEYLFSCELSCSEVFLLLTFITKIFDPKKQKNYKHLQSTQGVSSLICITNLCNADRLIVLKIIYCLDVTNKNNFALLAKKFLLNFYNNKITFYLKKKQS